MFQQIMIQEMESRVLAELAPAMEQLWIARQRSYVSLVVAVLEVIGAAVITRFGLYRLDMVASQQGLIRDGLSIVTLAILWVWLCNCLRTNERFLNIIIKWQMGIRARIAKAADGDFLLFPFVAAFVVLMAQLVMIVALFSRRGSVFWWEGGLTSPSGREGLANLRNWLAAILGAQVSLLAAMFGSFIGRYSGILARVVLTHRAVVASLLIPVLALLIVIASDLGFIWTPFLQVEQTIYIASLFGILIVVWIIVVGVETDRAIQYAGTRFSALISKQIKQPYMAGSLALRTPVLSKILSKFGLYFPDISRIQTIAPAKVHLEGVRRYFVGVLNVAYRAVIDHQFEVVAAALDSMARMTEAYSNKRKYYHSSHDLLSTYLTRQLPTYLETVAENPNQEILSQAVVVIGRMVRAVLDYGTTRRQMSEMDPKERSTVVTHDFMTGWVGLLESAFELGSRSQHNNASREVLGQLSLLATRAHSVEGADFVAHQIVPAIQRMHHSCSEKTDTYSLILSSDCFRPVLQIWCYELLSDNADIEQREVHFHCVRTLRTMAIIQVPLEDPGNMYLLWGQPGESSASEKLVGVASDECPSLQFIAYFAIKQRLAATNNRSRLSVEWLNDIFGVIAQLCVESGKKSHGNIAMHVAALFESGCMAFYVIREEHDQLNQVGPRVSRREKVVSAFLGHWLDVTRTVAVPRVGDTFQWIENHFAVAGLALHAVAELSEDDELRCEVIDALLQFVDHLKRALSVEHNVYIDIYFDYVQLLAAWVYEYLGKNSILSQLISLLPLVSTEDGRIRENITEPYGGVLASRGFPVRHSSGIAVPRRCMNMEHFIEPVDRDAIERVLSDISSEEMLLRFEEYLRTGDF